MSSPPSPVALAAVAQWPVEHAAAAVINPAGEVLESIGDGDRVFRLASISKLLTTYAVLIGVEEEAVGLHDPVGPSGSTLAHVLAHTSGLGFDVGDPILCAPGQRRIYSNAGIEAAADHLAAATGISFADYLQEAVLDPLGMMATELRGSPAHQVFSTVTDLTAFVRELWHSRLVNVETLREAAAVKFAGLSGVVPGVGRFDPCDWGYGFERNFGRPRHWAGQSLSPHTIGHFGGAGTFLWVDPEHRLACIALTDRPFDDWALQVWPPLCDAIIATYPAPGRPQP